MDYRHFREDRFRVPAAIRRHLHKLRQVGLALMAAGLAIPFLILVKALKSTVLANGFALGGILLGPILYLVGMVFDTYVDRSK